MASKLLIARCLESEVDSFLLILNEFTLLLTTDTHRLYSRINGVKIFLNPSADNIIYTSLNTSDNDITLAVGGSYVCDTTAGTFNVNIPEATVANENQEIYLLHLEAGSNLTSRLQYTAFPGQIIGKDTLNSLSLGNSLKIVSNGSDWFIKDFSNEAFGKLMEIDRNAKKIDILEDYGFHLTKDGELVFGDLSIDGSWRIRTEGVYLKFDRAISGVWELGVQTLGASVETDNFIIETPAGHLGFRDKDGIKKSLVKPSIDGQGAVLGNVDGRVGFVSNGELLNVFPNQSVITEVVVEPQGGTFSTPAYAYVSDGIVDDDIMAYGGTFWSNSPASKHRVAIVNVDGYVMAETQAKPLYDLNEDMIPVVVGENKFSWLFPVGLLKGTEYTIQVFTSNLIGVELNPSEDDMAFVSRRQTIDIGNVSTLRRWRTGDSFVKGEELFVDIIQADYDKDKYGYFIVTEDFIATGSIDDDILFGKIKRVDLYPGTYTSNGDGWNLGWGNIGIGQPNPTEKLDVVGNVKAIEFIGDGSRLTGVTTTGAEMLINKNLPNGYAGLDGSGKLSTLQIPVMIGTGDMLRNTYDPTLIGLDVFQMDNMIEGLDSKVMTSSERNKLSSIETGAEVNVQSDWEQTNIGADDYVKNKPVVNDDNGGAGYFINEVSTPCALSSNWYKVDATFIPQIEMNLSWNGIDNRWDYTGTGADVSIFGTFSGLHDSVSTRDVEWEWRVNGLQLPNPGKFARIETGDTMSMSLMIPVTTLANGDYIELYCKISSDDKNVRTSNFNLLIR